MATAAIDRMLIAMIMCLVDERAAEASALSPTAVVGWFVGLILGTMGDAAGLPGNDSTGP